MARPPSSQESETRQLVIDAAVASIIEDGFYQTSTNAVARKTGMTWGVLQHHFGSREGLLLATLEDGFRRFKEAFAGATIAGDNPAEVLRSYYAVLDDFYGRPEFQAYLQIQLDLLRNPKVSATTAETVRAQRAELATLQAELLEAVAPGPLGLTIFHALRGFIFSRTIEADVLGIIRPGEDAHDVESANALIDALAELLPDP